jgi:hypothetical protein
MDFDGDFLEDIGEGAYYSDEETRTLDGEDENHPTDLLIEELERIPDEKEVVP